MALNLLPLIDDLTGTVFAGHHQPLRVWILCLYFMGLNLSNSQIAKELGLDPDSAQDMTTPLRNGLLAKQPAVVLSGAVERSTGDDRAVSESHDRPRDNGRHRRVRHLFASDGMGLQTPHRQSWEEGVCSRRRRRWISRSACQYDGGLLVAAAILVDAPSRTFPRKTADLPRVLSVRPQRPKTRKSSPRIAHFSLG